MQVQELIEHLYGFPPEAEVIVVVNAQPQPYKLTFGGGDGCGKEAASEVSFLVNTCIESQGANHDERPASD